MFDRNEVAAIMFLTITLIGIVAITGSCQRYEDCMRFAKEPAACGKP